MSLEIKKLMENFLIISEGELLTSDMKYRINHMHSESRKKRIQNYDPSTWGEDGYNKLKICKEQIIKCFKEKVDLVLNINEDFFKIRKLRFFHLRIRRVLERIGEF